ncbi:MAG: HAMP domain-containing histidine kinase [Betaproteobacteria bacterium]|nr:HAMP domain-containing histidine kinase [Betaproteobacteria bacterium]
MDVLVAAAIHDAKNALNTLGVWLDEAQRECASPTPSPALARAKAIASTLSGQLVELLALYRAGDGSLRLAVEDQHLEDFLADLMAELDESRAILTQTGDTPENAIVIDTDFAVANEVNAWAFDAYLVKFVLLDALRNALRHARRQVRFSLAAAPGGGIRFSIADDGDGYPEAILRNENRPATEMSAASSGLGLSFARLIAARHATPAGLHGRLELGNDGLGKNGARFSLFLP